MKAEITALIRLIVPRSWRNALRRPRITTARVWAKVQFRLGKVSTLSIRPGWSVRCHPICVAEFDVFRGDPVQCAEMNDFISHCRPGMQFLDVGAHWGIFTLAALRYGGSGVRALCVEPSPEAVSILRHNLRLNETVEQVGVVQVAAGAKPGDLQMLTTGAGGADYLVVSPQSRADCVSVEQVDLTDLCRSSGFLPTHVKMDIEGFEEEGLLGAQEMLQRCRPILFLELHGEMIRRRGRNPRTVLTMLRETGYTTWKKSGTVMREEDLESQAFNARFVCLPDTGEPS